MQNLYYKRDSPKYRSINNRNSSIKEFIRRRKTASTSKKMELVLILNLLQEDSVPFLPFREDRQ